MEKLTVEKILERKKVIKPLEMVYHSDFLNGDIEIKKINPDKIAVLLSEAQELGQIKSYQKLIYESCPLFQKKELHQELKPTEPYDIVDLVFESNLKEILELGNKILMIYGFIERVDFNTLKK